MKKTIPKSFSRELLTELLPQDAYIIEAGAHIGRDTIKLAQLFPQGTIYAFEPNPHTFEQLRTATQTLPNIHCYQLALSNNTGTATFYVSTEISALSSLHKPGAMLEKRPSLSFEQIVIETITLDEWVKKHNIPRVDFIWLDTQGHELTVLQGAQTILPEVKALLIEVNLEQRYHNQPLYPEIRSYLETYGFNVTLEHLHHGTWGNVLFTR